MKVVEQEKSVTYLVTLSKKDLDELQTEYWQMIGALNWPPAFKTRDLLGSIIEHPDD